MMYLLTSAVIALATLVLLAYAACREAPRRRVRVRHRPPNL
ncbi:hypothetical protein [Frateuria sp. STR12]|nr:hypothetical protein [Frateuria sp. STR12]MCX7513541.1 hypothetical protein [Frateuria sp. STR12]